MRFLLLLALIAALALAGCGGDDDETTTTPSGTATEEPTPAAEETEAGEGGGDTVTVTMKNIQFDPQAVTVKVGQTVKWVNEDDVQHDADATSGADFNLDLIDKGGTIEWKAEAAGDVEYVCSVHPNMTGTITVE
jgi:plastocyanin